MHSVIVRVKQIKRITSDGLHSLSERLKLFICKFVLDKHYFDEVVFFNNVKRCRFIDEHFDDSAFRHTIHQLDKKLTGKNENYKFQLKRAIEKLNNNTILSPEMRAWGEKVVESAENSVPCQPADSRYCTGTKDIKKVILSRRSVRAYSGKKIPEETISEIIECALWAPTGCNRQNLKFLILTKTDDLKFCQKIAGEPGEFVAHASHAIIVMGDCRTYYLPATRHQVYMEAGAAIQNMLLFAHSISIDSIWLNWAGINKSNQKLRDRFNLERYILPVAMVLFGYRESYNLITPARKSIQESIVKV